MPRYRVENANPYTGRDEDHGCDTLQIAAELVEDLTGTDAETVVSDVTDDGGPWHWEDPESGRTVVLRLETAS